MRKIKIENMPELPYAIEESISRLRVNISFLGNDVKKILIISAMENEGKSYVAVNLWRQLAAAGMPTLLLDGDMRKSMLVKRYGMKAEDGKKMEGFSHVLASSTPIKNAPYATNLENAYILPNTENLINRGILLESKRFQEMMDTMSEQFRYVLVDAPPLALVSDGEKIASMCDGAILVVHSGEISKKLVKNSIQQIERAGCPLLGVVLNFVETSKSGSYYRAYGKKGYYYYGGSTK